MVSAISISISIYTHIHIYIHNLSPVNGTGSIIKHKIDAIDTEGLTYKYTLLEGEIINGKCDSITYEVKFEASDSGGCIIKMKGGCCTRGTVPCEADLDSDKASYLGLYKAVETYLLSNPIAATA